MNSVREAEYRGTVHELIIDIDRLVAALEDDVQPATWWAARGVDWFVFDPRTFRIKEVRPYHAAPFRPDIARRELLDFDYAGQGYPT